ncbi:MAG: DNA replication/repair protein RecF [Firmicutes bacterium]|nr:DNA replication/repair protein RecF [Bacillota bacterium]
MFIKEIKLKNFRNYDNEIISFSDKINIILGNNGQGKTNLLEGIYLNAFGKSFKRVNDKDLVKFGQDFCRLEIYSEDCRGDEEKTEIVIDKTGKKGIKVNGVKINKTSEMMDRLFITVFSPEDLKIVKDEPERRRKFIDRELCQIRKGYLKDLNDYRKVLKQRNTYLKEDYVDEGLLYIWDRELSAFGSRIIKKREKYIEKINEISSEIHSSISGGKEEISIKYEPSIYHTDEEKYFNEIEKYRNDDIRNRNTSKGPHRDDIRIEVNGTDLRKFGSQGQQRTAALSLKLSEIKIIEEEKGEKPILLLDDVLSELDSNRQKYLINSLESNQMFITDTDLMAGVARNLPEGKIIKISEGRVEVEI